MRIGHLYQVVGIPAHVHQWPNVTWSVEACSVRPWTPKCKTLFWLWWYKNNQNYAQHVKVICFWLPFTAPCLVSNNFQNLQTAMACSPWRFAAIVANSFGSPVIPPGLYNTLKLGLLLSLVQTEDNPDSPNHLDVLALTSETLIIDRSGFFKCTVSLDYGHQNMMHIIAYLFTGWWDTACRWPRVAFIIHWQEICWHLCLEMNMELVPPTSMQVQFCWHMEVSVCWEISQATRKTRWTCFSLVPVV